ncbi:tigger transposable element-derived protein 1 [Trichonephila clavipes]|nr:tigger transposable element-derived protein 1 [Trichonephila clavipes]
MRYTYKFLFNKAKNSVTHWIGTTGGLATDLFFASKQPRLLQSTLCPHLFQWNFEMREVVPSPFTCYGESTVRAIKKNEAAIRKSVISGTKLSTKFASYTRDVLLERTERAIAIWIEEQVQRRIPVSGYLIQEKALQFYKSMKQSEPSTSTSQAGKEFSASKGWLTGFLKRNALHNIKITGESATADEGAAKIFPEEPAKIIEDGDYSADQVFNADETGLYWKKLPNRTYIAKDEKTASGHKASKDRVTLLLCSNASGDRMLKPLLINKSLRPRALKGKDLKLPVH